MKKRVPAPMVAEVTTSTRDSPAGRSCHALALATGSLIVGLFALATLGPRSTTAQDDPTPTEPTGLEIMWTKLDLSHNVLDALAVNDFEALEAYAEDLEALGTAGFLYILDTDRYRVHADGFRAAARALGQAAKDNNAEAGTLAYMDLTLRCIRCHQSFDVVPR